ncbi:MAG: UbiA family prenyltransferase [Bacteroidetes bacterium]|nr:UbiA family prenyltransferase [Bacteroidota bacterium]
MTTHFIKKLRLPDAFKYKVPVLITSVYAVIWMHSTAPALAYTYLFLSIVTITGIAGYAYLLNDWSDEQKDLIAGKSNATLGLSVIQKWGLLLLFGALAIVPWFYFPTTPFTLSLLVLELALFAAYSLPPLRLKERPIIGVVVDALYAHVVPVILATATFGLLPSVAAYVAAINTKMVVMVAHWQFFNGIRNILLHQEEDRDKDIQSNTKTFATTYILDITSSVIKAI